MTLKRQANLNISRILGVAGVFIAVVTLFLSLRGLPGNPSAEMLNSPAWKSDGPFELSPERGRFALLYSVVEDRSLQFSLPIARFTTPDLAINPRGEYVSLFAPAVSFIVIPGYLVGKWFGASQIGAYVVVGLFAIANLVLIRLIAGRLGVRPVAGWLGGISFLFATPAFAYGVNLYQHHISVFLILSGIYILLRWKGWVSLMLVWFLCALSVAVDNPNFFLMFPIGLYAFGRIVGVRVREYGLAIQVSPWRVATLSVMAIPIALFLSFNYFSHGDPLKLSGSLPGVSAIGADGLPAQSAMEKALDLTDYGPDQNKQVVGFFNTRNVLNGFSIHLFGPDRGMVYYTPLMFLGVWGFVILYRRRPRVVALFAAVALVDLVLYSLWDDPWGGWAFGSRYLIPAYAILSIGLAAALDTWRKNYLLLTVFFVAFTYSAGVNALGALTSSANPPQVQVLDLEKLSGKVQRYSYDRNWQYLHETGSKSFVYQVWGKDVMTAVQYYYLVTGLVVLGGAVLMAELVAEGRRERETGSEGVTRNV